MNEWTGAVSELPDFHGLAAGDFPIQLTMCDMASGATLWRATLNEPGRLALPSREELSVIRHHPVRFHVRFADGVQFFADLHLVTALWLHWPGAGAGEGRVS